MAGFGNTTVTVDTRELDRIASKLGVSTDGAIRAMAFAVQDFTENSISAWPAVDTANYKNSIMVKPASGAEYRKRTPPDDVIVSIPTPPEHSVYVGPTVNYAVYVEFGTYKMSARPSLIPSFEAVCNEWAGPDKWKIVVEGNYAGDINAIKQAAGL
jgi:hypothetical protein